MIQINITNTDELALTHLGQFKLFISKLFQADIQKQVETVVANRLQEDMANQGITTEISVR